MRSSHLKQALDLAGTPIYLQDILLTWLSRFGTCSTIEIKRVWSHPNGDFAKAALRLLCFGLLSPPLFASRWKISLAQVRLGNLALHHVC